MLHRQFTKLSESFNWLSVPRSSWDVNSNSRILYRRNWKAYVTTVHRYLPDDFMLMLSGTLLLNRVEQIAGACVELRTCQPLYTKSHSTINTKVFYLT